MPVIDDKELIRLSLDEYGPNLEMLDFNNSKKEENE